MGVVDKFEIANYFLIEGYSVSESIQLYGLFLSIVITLSTIAQVVVAFLISRSVDRSLRRMAELSAAQHIHNQWQNWNTMVITNKEFRDAVIAFEDITETETYTKKRFLAFFSLNIIEEAYFAEKNLGLSKGLLQTHIKEQIEMLRTEEELIRDIFSDGRGYNSEFISMCLLALDDLAAKKKSGM